MEVNYASNGKANAALVTGIIGTSGCLQTVDLETSSEALAESANRSQFS